MRVKTNCSYLVVIPKGFLLLLFSEYEIGRPPEAGVDRVMVPGDSERWCLADAVRNGLTVPDAVLDGIDASVKTPIVRERIRETNHSHLRIAESFS